MNIIITVIHKT